MTTPRSAFLSLVVASTLAGASFMLPASVFAETPAVTAADAVQQPYTGVINDDNVYVRSGPGEIFYATSKLNKGTKITVVATRKDWVKIIPPDGSYCYVARLYVERRGDGTVGRVTKPDLNVRAGSTLNGLKTTVQTSLAEGDDVKILPDQNQDEYFKIVPPAGAYLYVKKTFVDAAPDATPPVVAQVASAKQTDPVASDPVPTVVTPPVAPAVPAVVPPVVTPGPVAVAPAPTTNPTVVTITPAPATQPVVAAVKPEVKDTVAMAPATQPIEPSADEKFDTLETAFLGASGQPLDQQPLDTLLTKYTALSSDTTLASSMRRIVDMRIQTIKVRADAQKQYADALKMQADAKARQASLRAESDELNTKIKDQTISIYTAVGTLRISSLQQSGTTLYRLTDPGTGRTLVYIKSNDAKYSGLLNQFIGVKGDVTEDTGMNLKFIAPTDVEAVDPAKVNDKVTATIIPPSLLSKTATASVGN